jgi:hypothetical protein
VKTAVIAVAAAIVGIGVGASSAHSTTHTRTISHTVQGPIRYRTQIKHETTTRTPQACVTALTGLRQAALTETRGVGIILRGVQSLNVPVIKSGTAVIGQATSQVHAITVPYGLCLASAH